MIHKRGQYDKIIDISNPDCYFGSKKGVLFNWLKLKSFFKQPNRLIY